MIRNLMLCSCRFHSRFLNLSVAGIQANSSPLFQISEFETVAEELDLDSIMGMIWS